MKKALPPDGAAATVLPGESADASHTAPPLRISEPGEEKPAGCGSDLLEGSSKRRKARQDPGNGLDFDAWRQRIVELYRSNGLPVSRARAPAAMMREAHTEAAAEILAYLEAGAQSAEWSATIDGTTRSACPGLTKILDLRRWENGPAEFEAAITDAERLHRKMDAAYTIQM